MAERLLPVGTPVILKVPLTERDVPQIEPCSYTMGRISEYEPVDDRYGIQFEGLNTTEGNHPMTFYYKRDEFVLARPGT
jgi:hypothetical protein